MRGVAQAMRQQGRVAAAVTAEVTDQQEGCRERGRDERDEQRDAASGTTTTTMRMKIGGHTRSARSPIVTTSTVRSPTAVATPRIVAASWISSDAV